MSGATNIKEELHPGLFKTLRISMVKPEINCGALEHIHFGPTHEDDEKEVVKITGQAIIDHYGGEIDEDTQGGDDMEILINECPVYIRAISTPMSDNRVMLTINIIGLGSAIEK